MMATRTAPRRWFQLRKLERHEMAVFLTLVVGVSRVYLGVHYPTDVAAGWMFGFFWASFCWIVAKRFERETGVASERRKAE
jgi:membrane-associated phospholipid phosphatase